MILWLLLIALQAPAAPQVTKPDVDSKDFQVPAGQLTFDCEGQEGGRWHTRTPHVPSDTSGLTIGRGYDMKFRTPEQIIKELTAAGLKPEDAKLYAGAAKLYGESARAYMQKTKLPEITPGQQKALFIQIYAVYAKRVQALCEGEEYTKRFGKCDYAKLHPVIQDLLVDLHYRGDYVRKTKVERVQSTAVKNDLSAMAELLADQEFWKDVPKNRFERRRDYAAAALKKEKP
jgi:hypothetical protein